MAAVGAGPDETRCRSRVGQRQWPSVRPNVFNRAFRRVDLAAGKVRCGGTLAVMQNVLGRVPQVTAGAMFFALDVMTCPMRVVIGVSVFHTVQRSSPLGTFGAWGRPLQIFERLVHRARSGLLRAPPSMAMCRRSCGPHDRSRIASRNIR